MAYFTNDLFISSIFIHLESSVGYMVYLPFHFLSIYKHRFKTSVPWVEYVFI